MRLIDADALDMAFTMLRFNEDGTLRHWGDRQNWCLSGQEVEDLINSIPTAEPKRKTGICSVCKRTIPTSPYTGGFSHSFCPYCGADMRGGQDE